MASPVYLCTFMFQGVIKGVMLTRLLEISEIFIQKCIHKKAFTSGHCFTLLLKVSF